MKKSHLISQNLLQRPISKDKVYSAFLTKRVDKCWCHIKISSIIHIMRLKNTFKSQEADVTQLKGVSFTLIYSFNYIFFLFKF